MGRTAWSLHEHLRTPRAVQYIRMSTDSQDLSPEMQQGAIAAYAAKHGIAVIDTYLDAGKSGLTHLRGRARGPLVPSL